jgi:hypothetical protein
MGTSAEKKPPGNTGAVIFGATISTGPEVRI